MTCGSLHHLFGTAYQWLTTRRTRHPASSDIWDFRRRWPTHAAPLLQSFRTGETIALWSSPDALILKVLTGLLQARLRPHLSTTCYRTPGSF